MSDVNIAIVRRFVGSTAQDEDFTVAGFGTCKAYLAFMTFATSSDTVPIGDAVISVGAGDGTNQWACWVSSEDAQANGNTYRKMMEDHSVILHSAPGGIRDGWIRFKAFTSNGVTLEVDNSFGGDYQVVVVLFGGDDLSVDAGSFNPNATQNNTVTVTPGFQTDALIVCGVGQPSDTGTGATQHGIISAGMLSYDGTTIRQCMAAFAERDGRAEGAPNTVVRNDYIGQILYDDALEYGIEVTTVNATQFIVTTRDAAGDGTDDWGYLALGLPSDMEAWAGVVDSPTSTGSKAYTPTGLSVKGQFLMQLLTLADTVNAIEANTSQAGGWGIAVNTASDEFSSSFNVEDAAATTNTQTWHKATSVAIEEDDGASIIAEATFTQFDSAGWTQNFSTADGTARKFPSLVIEEEPAAGGGLTMPVAMHHYKQMAGVN